jgi:hypothetical protein
LPVAKVAARNIELAKRKRVRSIDPLDLRQACDVHFVPRNGEQMPTNAIFESFSAVPAIFLITSSESSDTIALQGRGEDFIDAGRGVCCGSGEDSSTVSADEMTWVLGKSSSGDCLQDCGLLE